MKKKIAFVFDIPKNERRDVRTLQQWVHPSIDYDILYLTDDPGLKRVLVKDITLDIIKNLNPGEAIRPEIHTPNQDEGDISDIPFFPNPAFKNNPYDILARGKIIKTHLCFNDFTTAVKFLMDFVEDFDIDNKYEESVILLAAESHELNKIRAELPRYEYRNERKELYSKMLEILYQIQNMQI